MKVKFRRLGRAAYAVVAMALATVLAVPSLMGVVSALGQVTVRSITLGSALASATGVEYTLSFKPVSNAQEIILDFCSNSPLDGDVCSATAGTNVPNVTGVSNAGAGGETVAAVTDSVNSTKHTVKITGATLTAGVQYSIKLGGITNQSTTGEFYGRIYTYTTGNAGNYIPVGDSSVAPTVGAGSVDFGGAAMSIVNHVIAITAKVQESLVFCVSGLAPGPHCGTSGQAVTTPNISLGHGTPIVLDSNEVDAGQAYAQVSTNATSGISVRMRTDNTCTGLSKDFGTSCNIPGVASGTTETVIIAGTAAFGLCVSPGAGVTVPEPYTDSTGGTATCPTASGATTGEAYGMDDTAANSVTSMYGTKIFGSAAPLDSINSTCTFAATAALTTQAGVYTANEQLIATGTF